METATRRTRGCCIPSRGTDCRRKGSATPCSVWIHHERPAGLQYPLDFTQKLRWILKMLDDFERAREIERAGRELQRGAIHHVVQQVRHLITRAGELDCVRADVDAHRLFAVLWARSNVPYPAPDPASAPSSLDQLAHESISRRIRPTQIRGRLAGDYALRRNQAEQPFTTIRSVCRDLAVTRVSRRLAAVRGPPSRSKVAANRAAFCRNDGTVKSCSIACLIARGVQADGDMRMPAPLSLTRQAVSGWSQSKGTTTTGTPCENAARSVLGPPTVTTAESRLTMGSSGIHRSTWMFGASGRGPNPTSRDRDVVPSRSRHESEDSRGPAQQRGASANRP